MSPGPIIQLERRNSLPSVITWGAMVERCLLPLDAFLAACECAAADAELRAHLKPTTVHENGAGRPLFHKAQQRWICQERSFSCQ